MVIDMSSNLIEDYTNTVPISLAQFSRTPDPRYFYLNNNRLTYFSDLLLEQYGACSTTSSISTAYFVVGISNILLSNNNLTCDCQSYNLISYIQKGVNDFPQIYNGTALLTQATCSAPGPVAGQPYLSIDFSLQNNCDNYTLPNISDIFCSLIPNDTRVTLTTPTYWPSTTTADPSATTGNTNTNVRFPFVLTTRPSMIFIVGSRIRQFIHGLIMVYHPRCCPWISVDCRRCYWHLLSLSRETLSKKIWFEIVRSCSNRWKQCRQIVCTNDSK